MPRIYLKILFCCCCLAIVLNAADYQQSLRLYLNCDDLQNPPEGVKYFGAIRLRPGKFGQAFLMERRTYNLAPNGDFSSADLSEWILDDNVRRQNSGGIDNGAGLEFTAGGMAAIPVCLQQNVTHTISFSARGEGSLAVVLACAGEEHPLLTVPALSLEYGRYHTVMIPKDNLGTVRFLATGQIWLDQVMVDANIGYPNSFAEPLKQRSVDKITLDIGQGFFNQEAGAMACWLKVPWFSPEVYSTGGNNIFAVYNLPLPEKVWGAQVIMATPAYNRRTLAAAKTTGALTFLFNDAKFRTVAVGVPFAEVKNPGDVWRHLVFNWQLKDDWLHLEVLLDGGSQRWHNAKPFGPGKALQELSLGYSAGAYINGLIDEFALFNRPLTVEECRQIFSAEKPLR